MQKATIRLIVSWWVLAAVGLLAAAASGAEVVRDPRVVDARVIDARVIDAIVSAVQQRVGSDAEVIVQSAEIFMATSVPADARLDASPDPAARLGATVRFFLTVNGVRCGRADVPLQVTAMQARAARFIPRGATISAGDVNEEPGELAAGPLRRRPRAAELVGGRTLRDLAEGAIVPAAAVAIPPTVRTGQTVTAVSRAFGIEASATMVAAESGESGAIIRVVNRATRKPLRARIVSSEVVEIIHD